MRDAGLQKHNPFRRIKTGMKRILILCVQRHADSPVRRSPRGRSGGTAVRVSRDDKALLGRTESPLNTLEYGYFNTYQAARQGAEQGDGSSFQFCRRNKVPDTMKDCEYFF